MQFSTVSISIPHGTIKSFDDAEFREILAYFNSTWYD